MKTLARRRDTDEILDRLRAVRPDSVRRWGRMSAHQMVCHVADAFRMVTEALPVSSAPGFRQRTIIKWIALYLPMRWPAGVRTVPEIDQEFDGSKPAEFARDLADLQGLVERFAARATALDGVPHPIFGRLSDSAWLRWGYLHADHHLRQFGM